MIVSLPFGPAGWGDPVDRTVPDLRQDLASGAVSRPVAEGVYGAVIGADGAISEPGTLAARREIIAERLGWPPAAPRAAGPGAPEELTRLGPLGDRLELAQDPAGRRWVRCCCGAVFGQASQNWRELALVSTDPPAACGLQVSLGGQLEFRRYCCPGCGRLHAADIRPIGAPHLHDQRPPETGRQSE